MDWHSALFGMACAGAIVCAGRASDPCATLMAWLMVSLWAGANILWLTDQTAMLPLIELPVAVAGYALWFDDRKRWQAWFAGLMAARLFLHVVYPGSGAAGEVAFLHVLNATFFAALVAISWTGGISDAVGAIRRHRGVRRFRLLLSAPALAMAPLARP